VVGRGRAGVAVSAKFAESLREGGFGYSGCFLAGEREAEVGISSGNKNCTS
jgi:hypothetical protein